MTQRIIIYATLNETVQLKNPVIVNKRVGLEYMQGENPLTNINETNNILKFKEQLGGGSVSATLTPGNYKASSLAAEIKAQMESVSPNGLTYTVTIPRTTNKMIISSTDNFKLIFATVNEINRVIGFEDQNYTYSTSFTASYPMNYQPYIHYLVIRELKNVKTISNINGFDQVISSSYSPEFGSNFDFKSSYYNVNSDENLILYSITLEVYVALKSGEKYKVPAGSQKIVAVLSAE